MKKKCVAVERENAKEMSNQTKTDKKRHRGLSPKQELALIALVKGNTIEEAARFAGVHRSSLHSWKSQDPVFILEFNRAVNNLRRVALSAHRDKISELVSLSMETLTNAIRNGSTSCAKFVLEMALGMPQLVSEKFTQITKPPDPLLPEDPDEVIRDIAHTILKEIAEEQGVSELEISAREKELSKVKDKLIEALQAELNGRN
jgi:hypothetical protein